MKARLLILAVACAATACGNKSMPPPDAGSGGGDGGSNGGGGPGGGEATGGGGDGGGSDAGTGGGAAALGTSCSSPIPLALGAPAPRGVLDAPGKKLHYRVSVNAGDFLVMTTAANPMDDDAKTDTTVSV